MEPKEDEAVETEDGEIVETEEIVEEEKPETDLTDEERKELEELRKKDLNFRKLRDSSKKTKAELDKEREDLAKDVKDFKDNLVSERKSDALDMLVGEDKEMRKKVLLNYDRIVGDANTKQEIFAKMKDAANMTGGVQEPNPLARQHFGGGDRFGTTDKRESDDSREMREKMRISDEDKKKYGGKDWKPKL